MWKGRLIIAGAAAVVILAAVLVCVLTRGKSVRVPEPFPASDEEGDRILLIDYCVKTVATVGGNGYRETVLYQNKDGSCEVHYYSRSEDEPEESHAAYRVDPTVVADAYALISRNRIGSWNEKKYGPGPDGTQYVLKYRDNGGECIRVTSDNMPEDGIPVLREIKACLDSYADSGSAID